MANRGGGLCHCPPRGITLILLYPNREASLLFSGILTHLIDESYMYALDADSEKFFCNKETLLMTKTMTVSYVKILLKVERFTQI